MAFNGLFDIFSPPMLPRAPYYGEDYDSVISQRSDRSPGDPRYMRQSPVGEKFVKGYEKFRAHTYDDGAGNPTVGWGHRVYGQPYSVTPEEGESLYQKDIGDFQKAILEAVKVPLTQGQYDTLVSFAYNSGTGGKTFAKVIKDINTGDMQGAIDRMGAYTSQNPKVRKGLENRRAGERSQLWEGAHTLGVAEENTRVVQERQDAARELQMQNARLGPLPPMGVPAPDAIADIFGPSSLGPPSPQPVSPVEPPPPSGAVAGAFPTPPVGPGPALSPNAPPPLQGPSQLSMAPGALAPPPALPPAPPPSPIIGREAPQFGPPASAKQQPAQPDSIEMKRLEIAELATGMIARNPGQAAAITKQLEDAGINIADGSAISKPPSPSLPPAPQSVSPATPVPNALPPIGPQAALQGQSLGPPGGVVPPPSALPPVPPPSPIIGRDAPQFGPPLPSAITSNDLAPPPGYKAPPPGISDGPVIDSIDKGLALRGPLDLTGENGPAMPRYAGQPIPRSLQSPFSDEAGMPASPEERMPQPTLGPPIPAPVTPPVGPMASPTAATGLTGPQGLQPPPLPPAQMVRPAPPPGAFPPAPRLTPAPMPGVDMSQGPPMPRPAPVMSQIVTDPAPHPVGIPQPGAFINPRPAPTPVSIPAPATVPVPSPADLLPALEPAVNVGQRPVTPASSQALKEFTKTGSKGGGDPKGNRGSKTGKIAGMIAGGALGGITGGIPGLIGGVMGGGWAGNRIGGMFGGGNGGMFGGGGMGQNGYGAGGGGYYSGGNYGGWGGSQINQGIGGGFRNR